MMPKKLCVHCGGSQGLRCECRGATEIRSAMKKGKPIYPEKVVGRCEKCNMHLTKQNVTNYVKVDNEIKDEYECPRCSHIKVMSRIKVEERYK